MIDIENIKPGDKIVANDLHEDAGKEFTFVRFVNVDEADPSESLVKVSEKKYSPYFAFRFDMPAAEEPRRLKAGDEVVCVDAGPDGQVSLLEEGKTYKVRYIGSRGGEPRWIGVEGLLPVFSARHFEPAPPAVEPADLPPSYVDQNTRGVIMVFDSIPEFDGKLDLQCPDKETATLVAAALRDERELNYIVRPCQDYVQHQTRWLVQPAR